MDDNLNDVCQYSGDLIREALQLHWQKMSKDEFNNELLNIPAVCKAKDQINFFGAELAAYIHNALDLGYDLNKMFTAEYRAIYRYFMKIMPETIEQIALINRYINEDMPADLIIALVKK